MKNREGKRLIGTISPLDFVVLILISVLGEHFINAQRLESKNLFVLTFKISG